jgi:hypothetical protein
LRRIELPPGDASFDGCVNDAPLLVVLFAYEQTGVLPDKGNCDGVVDDAVLLTTRTTKPSWNNPLARGRGYRSGGF